MTEQVSQSESVTVYVTIRVPSMAIEQVPELAKQAHAIVADLGDTTVEVRMVNTPPGPRR